MNLKQYTKQRERKLNPENNKIIELYKTKLRQVNVSKPLIFFIVAVLLMVAGIVGIQRHVYRDYHVLSSAKNEDTQSAGYVQLGDSLLKYGDDGAYLLSQTQKVLWNQTFEMSNPDVNVRKDNAVIYDKKGTLMYLLKKDGPVGAVETKFPVLQAKVTEKGTVVAVLEDGEKTWINYYASDGSTIAENQTRIENPGYPIDMAVAPNGEMLVVSYLFIKDGQLCSRIVYYSFGDEGQNKVDNIVADFTYENTIIPQLAYLNDQTCVAFRDSGYSVFECSGMPEEKLVEEFEQEIISIFYDDNFFGMVLKSGEEDKPYVLQVYDAAGRKKCSKDFDAKYQDISISKDMIIMCDAADVRMYNLKGILKFEGTMKEGAVKNLFQVASRHYIMVSENGINTIKLR